MTTFKYPIQAVNGTLVLSEDSNREAILQVVQTRYGERVLRNTYGTDLDEFQVVQSLEDIAQEVEQAIIDGTEEYKPLVVAVNSNIADDGTMYLDIEFDDDARTQNLTVKI